MVLGRVDFKDLKATLVLASEGVTEVSIRYGLFINTVVDFSIVAFVLFLIIKAMNRLKRKQEAAPAAPLADVVLLTEIRDLLKK